MHGFTVFQVFLGRLNNHYTCSRYSVVRPIVQPFHSIDYIMYFHNFLQIMPTSGK